VVARSTASSGSFCAGSKRAADVMDYAPFTMTTEK
jgi:hypothetical protein